MAGHDVEESFPTEEIESDKPAPAAVVRLLHEIPALWQVIIIKVGVTNTFVF